MVQFYKEAEEAIAINYPPTNDPVNGHFSSSLYGHRDPINLHTNNNACFVGACYQVITHRHDIQRLKVKLMGFALLLQIVKL